MKSLYQRYRLEVCSSVNVYCKIHGICYKLDEYVNDYNIHVFEIAWLTDEQLARFKNDFGIVARFFSERRKNPYYVPDDRTVITHVDAMLKLFTEEKHF